MKLLTRQLSAELRFSGGQLIVVLVVMVFCVLLAGVASASDHLDSPATVANPQADIGDVYAWTSPEGRQLNLAMTIQGHSFSEKIEYAFHVDSGKTFGHTSASDDRAQTHLPAIRFNDYRRVEGLTPALEQRARLHRTDADGSERYSRCAKSIVQVRPADARSQAQVSKPVGLILEIVPEANPYSVQRSSSHRNSDFCGVNSHGVMRQLQQ